MLQPQVNDIELYRAFVLLIPIFFWIVLVLIEKFSTQEYAGAFLGFVWQFQSSLILNILLLSFAMCWNFNSTQFLLYEIPFDLIIGQSVALSAIVFLLLRKAAFYWKLITSAIVLIGLYAFSPLTESLSMWWIGICALFVFSVIPSLLIAEWTADDTHLYLRSILQSIIWICLLLWFFPSIVFEASNGSWDPFLNRTWRKNFTYLLPLIIPTAILLSALKQFAIVGRGTAFPFDPPKKLVTNGIYAYVSNPMQVGICLAMGWWGVVTQSSFISCSAGVAIVLFITFKDVCNGSCAIVAEDPNWAIYQKAVPKWIPRSTPWRG